MTPTQCRMARAALGWSVRDLAKAADITANTVSSFELSRSVRPATVESMQSIFLTHGVVFADAADGVHLTAAQ